MQEEVTPVLTAGAVRNIYDNLGVPAGVRHVLQVWHNPVRFSDSFGCVGPTVGADAEDFSTQVVELQRIGNPSVSQPAADRFRTIISDGTQCCHAMLATQQNQLIHDNQVPPQPLMLARVTQTQTVWLAMFFS